MKKNSLYFLGLFFIFILSSCSDQVEQPSVSQAGTAPVAVVASSTHSPQPSDTPVPTSTVTAILIPTETFTPMPTQTPTEVVVFDSVRIIGVDDLGNYASVIFEFPGITKVYYVTINGSKYTCQIPEGVIDRLFCSGSALRLNEYASVSFYSSEDYNIELFKSDIYVPEPYATPLPAGDPNTWCPLRGQNISCETEHRMEDGEECWVQTCFDACGYYYSYHTCKYPPNNNFLAP